MLEESYMRKTLISMALLAGFASGAQAAPLMSADWAVQACNYWNTNPVLTTELAERWAKNDGGRGYKVIHMYLHQGRQDHMHLRRPHPACQPELRHGLQDARRDQALA